MSRPILPWRSPLVLLPQSGDPIWLRRLPWFDTPVRATFEAPDIFTVSVAVSSGIDDPSPIVVPLCYVHSWKWQFLDYERNYQAARRPTDPR